MDIVGANIRNLRRARGYLQKELADLAKMDPSNLSKLERGDYTWTRDNLERIAKALGVPVASFFEVQPKTPASGALSPGSPPSSKRDPLPLLINMDSKLDLILNSIKCGAAQ